MSIVLGGGILSLSNGIESVFFDSTSPLRSVQLVPRQQGGDDARREVLYLLKPRIVKVNLLDMLLDVPPGYVFT